MTTRWINKAVFTLLFLVVGAVGFVTVARAGDGRSFQFCYEYDCPKPHFSVLHKRAEPARHVDHGGATRLPIPRQPIGHQETTDNCCAVLGIDRHRIVVMAKDTTSGQSFQFVVPGRNLLGTLRPGQTVSVNYADMEVSVAPACGDTPCPIIAVSQRRPELAEQE
jgi:hypothetical protein